MPVELDPIPVGGMPSDVNSVASCDGEKTTVPRRELFTVSVLPTEERIFESRRCGYRLDVMTGNGGRGSPGTEESALATLRERCPREGRLSGMECPVLFILESTRFRPGSINETAGRTSSDLRSITSNGQFTEFGRAGGESYLPFGGVVLGVISVGNS